MADGSVYESGGRPRGAAAGGGGRAWRSPRSVRPLRALSSPWDSPPRARGHSPRGAARAARRGVDCVVCLCAVYYNTVSLILVSRL